MFTEETAPSFAAEFSSLLGAPLVTTEVLTPATDRDSYFRSCAGYEHVLFDPNTGLKLGTNQRERSVDHLFETELVTAVESRPAGLTMIFDQSLSRGRAVEDQLEEKLACFRTKKLFSFAYRSHACFLFVAQGRQLAERGYRLLCTEGRLPRHRFLGDLEYPLCP